MAFAVFLARKVNDSAAASIDCSVYEGCVTNPLHIGRWGAGAFAVRRLALRLLVLQCFLTVPHYIIT